MKSLRHLLASAVVISSACVGAPSDAPPSVEGRSDAIVYGEDDRRDVYAHPDESMRALVRTSIAALIPSSRIFRQPSGSVSIASDNLAEAYGVCADEPFAAQPVAADCSGVLIDDDLFLTAAHCFTDVPDCSFYTVVFDYAYHVEGELTLSSNDLYGCRRIVAQRLDASDAEPRIDFAIIQLDRPVPAPRRPATLRKDRLAKGDRVVAIGFPAGLPAKIDEGGDVIDARADVGDFFMLDSDTFVGSSGSGIFDPKGQLAGILVRGGDDWVADNEAECLRSRVVPVGGDGFPWEQATYATRAVEALCKNGYPSVSLCDTEPSCGDGFCTVDEFAGACPEDCGPDACVSGDCAKGRDGPVTASDASVDEEVDSGTPDDDASAIPKSRTSDESCAARPAPLSDRGLLHLVWLGAAALRLRRRRRAS